MHVGNHRMIQAGALSWCLLSLGLAGCFDPMPPGGGSGGGGGGVGAIGYDEIYDLGLLDYVGDPALEPTRVDEQFWYRDLLVHRFEFDENIRGPVCMRGDDFFVETRDGDSDDLMIFLQGGGVCMDEICAATVRPTINLRLLTAGDLIGIRGLLDRDQRRNPVRDYNVVHVPYCDGSVFAGDVDRILSDGTGPAMAYQRGLINLIAAFQIAKERYPNPPRIVLAGTSGGSYGSVLGTAVLRHFYPDTPMTIVADSGAPILSDQDPGFVTSVLTQVGAIQYLPDSCSDCLDNGHATEVIAWALDRDPNLRVAYMGHARDHVIGEFFMGSTPEQFEAAVNRETGSLVGRYPDRVFRYIKPGKAHMLTLDVGSIGTLMPQVVLYLFGPTVFTGPDVDRAAIGSWELGRLSGNQTDELGRRVNGYSFLDYVLHDPANAASSVQLGD